MIGKIITTEDNKKYIILKEINYNDTTYLLGLDNDTKEELIFFEMVIEDKDRYAEIVLDEELVKELTKKITIN